MSTPARIANLVDRGLEIRRQIKLLKAELEEIETELKAIGLKSDKEPLGDKESEGQKFRARGVRHVVPIIYTSDLLVGQFTDGSREHRAILDSLKPFDVDEPGKPGAGAASVLLRFFTPKQIHARAIEDASQFRRTAREILDTAAPAFLAACVSRDKHKIPKTQERIEWDKAEPI